MTQEKQKICMYLSGSARVISTSSNIPLFHKKGGNIGQYSIISYKDSNNPIM